MSESALIRQIYDWVSRMKNDIETIKRDVEEIKRKVC
jgi:regulator of replication initiation timing